MLLAYLCDAKAKGPGTWGSDGRGDRCSHWCSNGTHGPVGGSRRGNGRHTRLNDMDGDSSSPTTEWGGNGEID